MFLACARVAGVTVVLGCARVAACDGVPCVCVCCWCDAVPCVCERVAGVNDVRMSGW